MKGNKKAAQEKKKKNAWPKDSVKRMNEMEISLQWPSRNLEERNKKLENYCQ